MAATQFLSFFRSEFPIRNWPSLRGCFVDRDGNRELGRDRTPSTGTGEGRTFLLLC